MKLCLIICILMSLSGCVKYHTRAFCSIPKFETKHIDKYKCYFKSFEAYINGYCDPPCSDPKHFENDSLFHIVLNIEDTTKLNLPKDWWHDEDLKSELRRNSEIELSNYIHIDSLVILLSPNNKSLSLSIHNIDYSMFSTNYYFEKVLLPLVVTDIQATLFFTIKRETNDSLVYLLHRDESHKKGFYGGF